MLASLIRASIAPAPGASAPLPVGLHASARPWVALGGPSDGSQISMSGQLKRPLQMSALHSLIFLTWPLCPTNTPPRKVLWAPNELRRASHGAALHQSASPLPSLQTETSSLLVALGALAEGARAQQRCRPWWILAVWQHPLTP